MVEDAMSDVNSLPSASMQKLCPIFVFVYLINCNAYHNLLLLGTGGQRIKCKER